MASEQRADSGVDVAVSAEAVAMLTRAPGTGAGRGSLLRRGSAQSASGCASDGATTWAGAASVLSTSAHGKRRDKSWRVAKRPANASGYREVGSEEWEVQRPAIGGSTTKP